MFWYHMFGTTVGELNVYLHNSSSTGLGNPIWWMAGNRGDLWRAGEAEINTPEDFQVKKLSHTAQPTPCQLRPE